MRFMVVYRGEIDNLFLDIADKGDSPVDVARWVFNNIVTNSAHLKDKMFVIPMEAVAAFEVKGLVELEQTKFIESIP